MSSKSSSSKSQKQKSKKKKKDDSDNSDDSDFVPEFNGALRNSQSENSKMKNTLCLKCRNVIPYYRTSKISASLCEDCALTSIVNQRGNGRRSTGGRGRGRGRGRRKVASEFVYLNDEVGVPTLQNLCVKLICDHILDVEEFGDISPTALEKISKIICKHRKLDENTVRLFVGPEYDAIRLYDCTKLSPENLTDLALASSHIHTLHLSFVGQLCDSTLSVFADCLPLLKHLTLKGAYLVTDKAWGEFFRSIGKQLEYLELESAAKLERKGVRALVEVAAGVSIPVEEIVIPRVENDLVDDDEMDWTLTKQGSSSSAGPSYSRSSFLNGTSALIHLKLNDCPQLENSTVHLLQHLSQLQTLSLLESATKVTDETLTTLLSKYTNLTELYLSNAPLLTDESLVSIGKYAPKLTHLQLNQMENFTVEGVTSCLDHWASFIRSNTSGTTNANTKTESQYHQYLTFLDLTRSRAFNSTEILSPFLTFTGSSLQILNLNSLDSLSPDIFVTILEHCRNVEEMDICWVRCVDDVVMENLLTGLKLLRVVKIFGCHKVTECVVKKAGGWRNGSGELIKIVGSEFE
ncbi:hypothetical protein BKA69DRAFT_506123 [Paraphysoderma sedebokerense]|nr:hypothetical protein BKA69DRAFT_506123 [Paraphysoderma sedebokerense]